MNRDWVDNLTIGDRLVIVPIRSEYEGTLFFNIEEIEISAFISGKKMYHGRSILNGKKHKSGFSIGFLKDTTRCKVFKREEAEELSKVLYG